MGKRTRPAREARVRKSPQYADLAREARIVNGPYFFQARIRLQSLRTGPHPQIVKKKKKKN